MVDSLFGDLDDFTVQKQEWKDMPEYTQENLSPWKTLKVHFENIADMEAFAKLVNQSINLETQYIWYPQATLERVANKRWVDEEPKTEPKT